jgi:Cu/Ag efflux protein CusF
MVTISKSRLPTSLPYRHSAVLKICVFLILFAALTLACRRQTAVTKVQESPSPAATQKNPLEPPAVVIGKPYPGKGVVTLINLKEGWIEIDHEEIEGLMPAMQMEWTAEPRSLLRKVKVGDKVEFVVVETGKGELITELKRVESPK